METPAEHLMRQCWLRKEIVSAHVASTPSGYESYRDSKEIDRIFFSATSHMVKNCGVQSLRERWQSTCSTRGPLMRALFAHRNLLQSTHLNLQTPKRSINCPSIWLHRSGSRCMNTHLYLAALTAQQESQTFNMTSQGIDPLGRRYEIIDFTGKAEATFATKFQQLPMAAAANWHDMREEVDQEIYRPQALDLGVVRLNQSSQYKKVLFYMTKKDVGIISEKSTTPTEMTRAMLDNIIWHAPYRFTFDKDGKSNHTKVKALAFYYFLDMGISDEFVDPDARFFEAFKFACINVAGKMVDIEDDREARARQRRKDKKARKKAMSQNAHSRSGQWSEGLQEPSHQRVTEDENDENHGMENHDEEGNYEEPPNAVQPRRLSDYQDQEASNKRHKSEHDVSTLSHSCASNN